MAELARSERLLPLGLAKGCVLTRPVAKDAAIGYDDDTPRDSVLLQLRRIRDTLYA